MEAINSRAHTMYIVYQYGFSCIVSKLSCTAKQENVSLLEDHPGREWSQAGRCYYTHLCKPIHLVEQYLTLLTLQYSMF